MRDTTLLERLDEAHAPLHMVHIEVLPLEMIRVVVVVDGLQLRGHRYAQDLQIQAVDHAVVKGRVGEGLRIREINDTRTKPLDRLVAAVGLY